VKYITCSPINPCSVRIPRKIPNRLIDFASLRERELIVSYDLIHNVHRSLKHSWFFER
ncbi:hypothetical protein K503DRAFT_766396, partial [Rhizopogon vinicolor AM-OR11-026]